MPFAFYSGRELGWREVGPGFAVICDQQFEFQWSGFIAVFIGDGIAEDYAVGWVPENHGVEEAFGIFVGELELPVLASVGSVVDAGLVAGTGGHEESFDGGEGNNGAEIEGGGVWDLGGSPGAACVGGAEVGAVSAGGPCDIVRDGAYSAKIFGGVGGMGLRGRLGESGGGQEKQ
jgi:hypothetical protein